MVSKDRSEPDVDTIRVTAQTIRSQSPVCKGDRELFVRLWEKSECQAVYFSIVKLTQEGASHKKAVPREIAFQGWEWKRPVMNASAKMRSEVS